MTSSNSFCARVAPYLLSLLRFVTGILFACHGAQKLFGYPAGGNRVEHLLTLQGVAAILEFAGGVLVLLGLFTRAAAFILSGEMAVAYFMVHASRALWPLQNGGELAVLYCFVFFYLSAAGGGPVSLDALRKKA